MYDVQGVFSHVNGGLGHVTALLLESLTAWGDSCRDSLHSHHQKYAARRCEMVLASEKSWIQELKERKKLTQAVFDRRTCGQTSFCIADFLNSLSLAKTTIFSGVSEKTLIPSCW